MKNIYDVSFELLTFIVYEVEEKYASEDEVNKNIIKVLTTDKTIFEQDIKDYLAEMLDEDLEVIKRICMLIVASKSFMLNNYEFNYGINEEVAQEMLMMQKEYSAPKVLAAFYNDSETAEEWIDNFRTYLESNYIEQNCSIEMGLKEHKDEILRINPFEIFEFGSYLPSDMLLSSEKAIQNYINLYSKALCLSYEEEEEEGYGSNEELLHSIFIDCIYEAFPNDRDVDAFIQYIISNIYEAMIVYGRKNCDEELLSYLETEPMANIIERFLQDYEFALSINDLFLSYNDYLDEYELWERREEFKKKGNIPVLKRINPYYNEEEIAYGKMKTERF